MSSLLPCLELMRFQLSRFNRFDFKNSTHCSLQTLKQNTPESQPMLESRLPALASAVCPQCSHVETNVRKQSIFCLVELLLIFGTEKVDALLEGLTVSQVNTPIPFFN